MADESPTRSSSYDSTLIIEDLKKTLGRRPVLRGVNLSVTTGVVGLLGPNGAGKTTLLRCVCTELKPTSGSISFLGLDPTIARERRLIRSQLGLLPQEFGYYRNFTLTEFVAYCAWLKAVPASRRSSAVKDAIERVSLTPLADTRLGRLSGGQRRRAGIAQAIVNDPKLLILDEPTTGLDPEQRFLFRDLVREIGRDRTVLLATHLVEDIAQTSTSLAIIADGSIIYRGTVKSLSESAKGDLPGDSPLERGYLLMLRSVEPVK